ncbi:uncharacterized protein LOC131254720 isoform X2 [Magnolia sinica]|uniref:uncharacterized protein LOC131254720 isoform X2 n=1 Tax=Magnolia sinica TaxID=86752 RepID=UPI00265AC894|nr:uncharacterized protein LOC131254720 isoform X2 [Magnolia sinica]
MDLYHLSSLGVPCSWKNWISAAMDFQVETVLREHPNPSQVEKDHEKELSEALEKVVGVLDNGIALICKVIIAEIVVTWVCWTLWCLLMVAILERHWTGMDCTPVAFTSHIVDT